MEPPTAAARLVLAESNLRGFRGLTLDAFGSLLSGGPERVPSLLRKVVKDHGGKANGRSLDDLWRISFRKHLRAEPFLAFRDVHQRAFQDIFKQLGIPNGVDECIDAAFDEYRHASAYPEVHSVLRELEHDVPLAVVSNMDTRVLLEALQTNGLAFVFVVTSDEEQRYKPDPSLFRRAVRYLGLPPEHVLHVGDSYAEDIVGASLIGMPSVLIQRPDAPEDQPKGDAKAKVRSLVEVRDFIRSSWEQS
jgi:2-haloalkanoic acid dehalogenase type II